MPAAKAHYLHVLQVLLPGRQNGGGEHPGVKIVHHVQAAFTQVHLAGLGKGVCSEDRYAHPRKHFRKVMVHQGVVLIGAGGQDHRVGPIFLHLAAHPFPGRKKGCVKFLLGLIPGGNGLPGVLSGNSKGLLHVGRKLPLPVPVRVPVEQRRVKGNAPALFGVHGIADHDGIALHHRAHGLAGGLCVLRLHRGDGGHENPVHPRLCQAADMAMDQLGREAHGV